MKYHEVSSKMLAQSLVEHCTYSTFEWPAMSMPIDMQAFIR